MMLFERLGETEAAHQVMAAIEAVTDDSVLYTDDLGGKATAA